MTELPRIARMLQDGIEAGAFLGAQLALSLQGREIDLCLGEAAPDVAMTPDHLLPWLSAGKPLTALAWAQLWEQALVDLDDRVIGCLPEFGVRGKDSITYRHLLTHTGGFRCIVDVETSGPDWDSDLQRVCQARLESKWVPGRRAAYQARSSWYVLGEVIQRLTDQPLADLVQDRICRPAGMMDTWLALPAAAFDEYGPRMARLYDTSASTDDPRPRPGASPAACPVEEDICGSMAAALTVPGTSARGPMRDLCRFYETLMRADGALVGRQTLEAMVARQRSGLFDETFRHHLDWGLGFVLDSNQHGIETVPYGYGRHASPRTYGHAGARCVSGLADPEHGLAAAIGVNGRLAPAAHVHQFREFLSAIYEDLNEYKGG